MMFELLLKTAQSLADEYKIKCETGEEFLMVNGEKISLPGNRIYFEFEDGSFTNSMQIFLLKEHLAKDALKPHFEEVFSGEKKPIKIVVIK